MYVKGIAWVGVATTNTRKLASFFEDVLGLRKTHDRTGFVRFQMPNGDALELFGPDEPIPPEPFKAGRVIPGFLVDDIRRARRELEAAGVPLTGPLGEDSRSGYAWQHFLGPDGLVYELTYDPARQ